MLRSLLILAACAVILAVPAVFAARVGPGGPKDMQAEGSYAVSYGSLQQLKSDSLVIAHGRVAGVDKVNKDFPPQLGSTYFLFEVQELVNSKAATLPERIVVRQYGHSDSQVNRELREDPLMKVGEDYVLFLKLSDDKQFYWVTGGPQGRFAVRSGKVYSQGKQGGLGDYGIDGRDVSDFIQTLR